MSHSSLSLAQAHLQAIRESAKATRAAAEVSKMNSVSVKLATSTVAKPVVSAATTASTQTVTESVTVPSTLTNFSQAFTPAVSLFNPALGTLVGVEVNDSATLTSNVISQNTSTSSGADITGKLNGTVSITGLDSPFTGNISAFTQTISVPPYSGSTPPDFTGPSTVAFPPLTQSQTQTVDYTAASDLAFFTASSGRASVTPVLTADATSIATAPNGNLQTQVSTSGLGAVTVTYTYVPVAPQVVKVVRYGIHHQPTSIQIDFSGFVDPTAATNPANYFVVVPNKYGSFTGPGRIIVPAKTASYNPTYNTVTLVMSKRLNFHDLAQLNINLPSSSGGTIQVVFGGAKDLGGFFNLKREFIPYTPGVTKLPK